MSRVLVAAMALCASLSFGSARCALAVDRPLSPAVQKQLDAGDFQAAVEAAKQLDNAAQRDSWLSQIVSAQLKGGSFGDAISTAALIEDDRVRSGALGEAVQTRSKGAAGGGSNANFGPLIDLITSTIEPDTWDDAGGPGAMREYRNGVIVDAEGVLQRTPREDAQRWLSRFRAEQTTQPESGDVRRPSQLRKISLTRLERLVQLRQAAGLPLDEEMIVLGGLERIEYVLIYPETGDLVLAGPAGDWKINAEGRVVSATTGRPVVRLDDLITIWRHTAGEKSRVSMGCSITPLQENLADTKAFLDDSQKKPLKSGGSAEWIEQVRSRVGRQRVDVFGIDPTTGAARVLVEADYHMKLVGLGIEESVTGVPNYLQMVSAQPQATPLDVLRWWFTMKYDVIETNPERNAFAIRGQAVQLQSENEMLNDRGQRIHTHQAEPLNREFAAKFTEHFATLAEKYPVYAELQNLFDLALVGTLIETEGLADQVGWHRTYFGVDGPCRVTQDTAPQMVETVANHTMAQGRRVIAAVSGGVHADPFRFVSHEAIAIDQDGQLESQHLREAPLADLPRDNWWWD